MRRALVVSGGGAKGSWQVGACQHLIVERGLWFDVIAGVSAGAVNAATLAQARDQDELAAEVEHLRSVWLGLRGSHDIYRRRRLRGPGTPPAPRARGGARPGGRARRSLGARPSRGGTDRATAAPQLAVGCPALDLRSDERAGVRVRRAAGRQPRDALCDHPPGAAPTRPAARAEPQLPPAQAAGMVRGWARYRTPRSRRGRAAARAGAAT